ncbi:hypothetical protein CR513_39793, partial [Mucuna pruriens]
MLTPVKTPDPLEFYNSSKKDWMPLRDLSTLDLTQLTYAYFPASPFLPISSCQHSTSTEESPAPRVTSPCISLMGAALKWYQGLRHEHIPTWRNLAKDFLNQYKYNMDMAQDCSQLQNMAKGEKETFKEYSRRWKEQATCIQPPLSDKEMVTMFINTLHLPFYKKMVGNMSSNFANLLLIGERVEVRMKKGRIVLEAATSHTNESYDSKEEEGTNLIVTSNLQLLAP